MLEAASSRDQRPVAKAGALDAGQHSCHALVRAAGRNPESIEAGERSADARIEQRRSRHPFGLHLHTDGTRSVLERRVGRDVRVIFGIEIAQNSDANGFGWHTLIYHGCGWPPRV